MIGSRHWPNSHVQVDLPFMRRIDVERKEQRPLLEGRPVSFAFRLRQVAPFDMQWRRCQGRAVQQFAPAIERRSFY